MPRSPRIAVVLPDFKPWGVTPFFNGVKKHAREHKWLLTASPVNPQGDEEFPANWARLKSWRVDGVILLTNSAEKLRTFRRLGVPLVYIGESIAGDDGLPRLMIDHGRVGRLAAAHLLGLGLEHLAFHGVRDRCYSREREQAFTQAAEEAKASVRSFSLPHMTRDALWNERYEPVKRWLRTLPKPIGIMAVSDYRALILLSACLDLGLRVPEDVAVIGVDNDLMICEFSDPTLTSISLNPYRMGLEAARILERVMRGERAPAEPLLIEPGEVVCRASTDTLHVQDPAVRRAIAYMQRHYTTAFKMDAVADALGVSRRYLEKHFRDERQTSPAEFLLEWRVKQAKALLASARRLSTEAIARQTGFGTGKNLRAAFQRVCQASPNAFRPDGTSD